MIRDLTHAEKSSLYDDGRCPYCASSFFFEGPPHDSPSVNWICITPHCQARFNLAPAALWFGQLVRPPKGASAGRTLPVQFRSATAPRRPVPWIASRLRTFLPWRNDGTRG